MTSLVIGQITPDRIKTGEWVEKEDGLYWKFRGSEDQSDHTMSL